MKKDLDSIKQIYNIVLEWKGRSRGEGPQNLSNIKEAYNIIKDISTFEDYGVNDIRPLKIRILKDLEKLYGLVQESLYGDKGSYGKKTARDIYHNDPEGETIYM